MRIQDIMSHSPVVCGENETVDAAVKLMWDHGCSAVPVVKEDGRIAGIVTDLGIGMATYMKGKSFEEVPVKDAMTLRVLSCRLGDLLESVERVMRDNQVRRLQVLDNEDRLVGVVSFSDVVRHTYTKAYGDGT